MTKWTDNVVEASNEAAYYKCFDACTPSDRDPDTSYERWYAPLEAKIESVLTQRGVPREATEYFDDWSPNCTRHVTVERRYLNPQVAEALHALLDGDYTRWRIDVIIVGTKSADDRVGQLGIWRDWVLCWGCGRSMLPRT